MQEDVRRCVTHLLTSCSRGVGECLPLCSRVSLQQQGRFGAGRPVACATAVPQQDLLPIYGLYGTPWLGRTWRRLSACQLLPEPAPGRRGQHARGPRQTSPVSIPACGCPTQDAACEAPIQPCTCRSAGCTPAAPKGAAARAWPSRPTLCGTSHAATACSPWWAPADMLSSPVCPSVHRQSQMQCRPALQAWPDQQPACSALPHIQHLVPTLWSAAVRLAERCRASRGWTSLASAPHSLALPSRTMLTC